MIDDYVEDIYSSPVFPSHFGRDYVVELVKALIDSGFLVDSLISSVSTYDFIWVKGVCIDDNDNVYNFEATWREDVANRSHPTAKRYMLEEVEVYD